MSREWASIRPVGCNGQPIREYYQYGDKRLTVDWQHIYTTWLDYMRELDSQVEYLATFDLVRLNLSALVAEVDWWPRAERLERLDNLKRGCGLYWETKRGTVYTAELLFTNRGSVERQAAILILASLDVKMKDVPDEWKGSNRRIMRDMTHTITEALPDIPLWHHASRDALPVTIGRYFPACDFIHPKTEDEMLYTSLWRRASAWGTGNW